MGTLQNNQAQLQLIDVLQKMIPQNLSLVDVMAELLQISTDSAYRRIRGETALSIDEAAILCRRFKLSFDSYVNPELTSASFRYSDLKNEDDFKLYMASIRNDMKMIKKANDPKIVWAAIDIPIFHHFRYPELGAFKLFYWLTAVVNDPELTGKKFNSKILSQDLINTVKEIYDLYSQIPSAEIWSDATVNSLIKQIEFYWDSGVFESKDQALLVCDEAKLEFENIQRQAEKSAKRVQGTDDDFTSFELYSSDIEIGNNCIQVTIGETKNMYVSFNTFNTLVTGNQSFCNVGDEWLMNLKSKATLISGISEKIRHKFFSNIFGKIERLRNKIESE